jgi:hypothetical protein
VCTADLGFTGGKNDIGAGTDTDFIGACTPAISCVQIIAVQKARDSTRIATVRSGASAEHRGGDHLMHFV